MHKTEACVPSNRLKSLPVGSRAQALLFLEDSVGSCGNGSSWSSGADAKRQLHPRAALAGCVQTKMFVVSVAILFAMILCSASALGQLVGQGAIHGTITDPSGAVIANASIKAVNTSTGIGTESKTTGAGAYNVSVAPGTYTVTITAPGFKTESQENIRVDAMASIDISLALHTGSESETVTVTAAPPQIETSNAMLGTTMNQDIYSELPALQDGTQRRATDFVALLPGMNTQATNGSVDTNTGVVNGSGSRGAVAGIYINGLPLVSVAGAGDPRFIWTAIPLDAVNQFQVYTAGYPATFEGQGVINYDVKGGTNQLHVSLFEFLRNTSLDTWGYLAPSVTNPITGKISKPVEHQNEYGMTVGFPLLKGKLFLFGSYDGYRLLKAPNYQYQTNPTAAMLSGDFSSTGYNIYDPKTTVCTTSGTSTSCKRTQFQYNGVANVIPPSRMSDQAKYMQKFLPTLNNSNLTNNYVGGQPYGRNNWSTANRVDFHPGTAHNLSAVIAFGRQATTDSGGGSSGAISSSANQAPPPYLSQQQFFVKSKVLIFEDAWVITPHLVNQLKYGYGRYDSTGINQSLDPTYSATSIGITGLPVGQASDSFPTVSFSGNAGINRWAGYSSNRNIASGYVLLDNVQWTVGRHNLTMGGQLSWMQYNYTPNSTGVNPLQLTFNSSETSSFDSTAESSTNGHAYASFLVGAVNSGSFTITPYAETGARFRPVSSYVQDDWKVNDRLTVNMGIRWDFYPSYREVQDRLSWMDAKKNNTLINFPGALAFAGYGNGKCNCRTNIEDYYKNFGPRIGLAYQIDPRTVLRASWGLFYTHGNAAGGSATSRQGSGTMGYSATPKTTTVSSQTYTNDLGSTTSNFWGLEQAYPSYTKPPTLDSTLGTYYTTASTAASQTVTYADPKLGDRSPTFTNWTFGFQRQVTKNMAATITYVGSEGHHLLPDSTSGRGLTSNQLDPKYLSISTDLSAKATTANLAKYGLTAPFSTFSSSSGTISQALKPFPQYSSVTDAYAFVGNTSYHALQLIANQRISNGLTFMTNYTWSRSIDANGTYRSGYDIPAAYVTDGRARKARALDRSLSLADQPHKFVFTGSYRLPFDTGSLGGSSAMVKRLAGGWSISGIYRVWSGSPLGIIMNSCNTNPSQQVCEPVATSGFTSASVRINGKYGHAPGSNAKNFTSINYINPAAFTKTPNYMFSALARTAPLGLRNSGSYQADASLRRTFKITERAALQFQADGFNLTNHTWFGYGTAGVIVNWAAPTTAAPSGSFTSSLGIENSSRDVQLAAHITF